MVGYSLNPITADLRKEGMCGGSGKGREVSTDKVGGANFMEWISMFY